MVVPDGVTRHKQDRYEDKLGEYQGLPLRARFNEPVLWEMETTETTEAWEGQMDFSGRAAFGKTVIISPQLDDTHPRDSRNHANRKTGIVP